MLGLSLTCQAWLFAAVALAQTPAAGIVVLDRTSRELLVYSDGSLGPIAAGVPAKCRLLPLPLWGRAAADALDESLPQQSDELGVPEIRLAGGGWLIKYRDQQSQVSGILWIDALGRPRILLELPLAGGIDPLLDGVAVSAVEARAAVVGDEFVTGRADVWLLRFDGSNFASTGTPSRRVTGQLSKPDPDPTSLAFARGGLFFVESDDALRRAPTDGTADATKLALPLSGGTAPTDLSAEIAVSRDGSTLAFEAGASEKSWDLYIAQADGSCSNLSQAAGQYQPPGFLPGTPVGPLLSLSPDGAQITYGQEVPDLEFFTRKSDGSDALVQLTTDQEFEHSLSDGSTVITFAARSLFSLGETGVNRDFYSAGVVGGVPAIANLTLTSGFSVAPFGKGAQMRPVTAVRTAADLGLLVVNAVSTAPASPSFDLWSLHSGRSLRRIGGLVAQPKFVRGGSVRGPVTLALLATDLGELLALIPDRPARPMRVLFQTPVGITLRGLSLRADGGAAAFIVSAGPGLEYVAAVDLKTGAVRRFLPTPGYTGGRTAWSPQGRVLFAWSPTPVLSAWAENPVGSGRVTQLPLASGQLELLAR
jgi:hypothetical protein